MTHPVTRLLMEEGGYFSAANTDAYHLATGQALWDMEDWSNTGNMVLRGGKTSTCTVIAGLRHIIPALADFRFDSEFIEWAEGQTRPDGQRLYNPAYLRGLRGMPFACEVSMMPDGSIAFPGPIGRITGDPIQAKWIDTILSDFLRRGSSIATKAARLRWVCGLHDIRLAENAFRRSNDTGGLLTAEIPLMFGLNSTSHMRAAMVNNLPAGGTMDHWYVMAKMAEYFHLHPQPGVDEATQQRRAQQHAFRCFMKEFPEYGILLLDTVTLDIGLEDAIIVLKEFGPRHYGVRIDSGDLAAGAKWCKQRLEAEGLGHVTIALSGGLRAINLYSLLQHDAPFNSAGIGEYFQYGGERQRRPDDLYEAPVNVEIVTKAGYAQAPDGLGFVLAKLSDTVGKASHAGILDRCRLIGEDGVLLGDVEVNLLRMGSERGDRLAADLVSLRLDTLKPKTFPAGTRVEWPIVPLLRGPEMVNPEALSFEASRERFLRESERLPAPYKRVDGSHSACPVGVELDHHVRCYQMSVGQMAVARV